MPWFAPWTWGKDRKIEEPETGIWFSGARDDYAINSNLLVLTPSKLASAMRNAAMGDTSEQYEVFEIVEQDPHVSSEMGKRRRAITCNEFKISPAVGEDSRAQQAADLCEELILGVDVRPGIINWREALYDLTDAVGKGFALSQIVWDLDGGRYVPRKLIRWPQRECVLGDPIKSGQYVQDHDEIRIITNENRVSGEMLKCNSWICHMQKSWSVPLAKAALFRSITWFYLFKHFSTKDWSIFLERYGLPFRIGKYPPNASGKERDALKNAVLALGKDSACVLPQLSTIEVLETKMTSSGANQSPHQGMVNYCNAEISKAINGNTMSSDQGDRGARSAKEAFQSDEEILTFDDSNNLAETIRRDLLTPIVRLNLGTDFPVPKCEFANEDEEDLYQLSQRDKIIAKDIGLEIPVSYFYQKYNLPEPEDGEETIGGKDPPPMINPLGPLNPNSKKQPPGGDKQQAIAEAQQQDQDQPVPNYQRIAEEIMSLATEKKKSVDWVISMMLSREESKTQ